MMNKRDSIITILLIVVGLAVAHEYVPTWIEGPDGEMPSFTYSNQIQDSKGNMWLFGGASYDWSSPTFSHVWKLDVRSNYTWTAIQNWPNNDTGMYPPKRGMSGPNYRPSARFDVLLWIDGDDNIWMYGGTTKSWSVYVSDLWMFNTTSLTWKLIHEEMPAEWGTKGTGVYNVTFPGGATGAATWTDFESNELWFLAGSNAQWRTDIWKYNIDSGIWTWMAGPKEYDTPRSTGIEKMTWYSADEVYTYAIWGPAFATDPSGDVWFHGGNIPGFFLNDELWRFRPSTLQWMWVTGEGTNQNVSYEGVVKPASSVVGSMSYVGNGQILYWPSYTNQENGYCDHLFLFNTSSMEWKFISGTINNETFQPPAYGVFRQPDDSNTPGTRSDFRTIALGAIWVNRGKSQYALDESQSPNRDTFVFSADICVTDANPCDTNAKCVAKIGYVDCECNAGFTGNGRSCQADSTPSSPTSSPSKSPSSKTNNAAGMVGTSVLAVGLALWLL